MILLVAFLASFVSSLPVMDPINVDKCKPKKWSVRHHIVYSCNTTTDADPAKRVKKLTPFACDPTNGLNVYRGLRPVYPGEEVKFDGFVYECVRNEKTREIIFRAKSCYIENERFNAGHWVRSTGNNVFLCYKELDNVLRIRVRRPVHHLCDIRLPQAELSDRCQNGITQAIINSVYGSGEPISYNLKTKQIINPIRVIPVHNKAPLVHDQPIITTQAPQVLPLQQEASKVAVSELIRAIKGEVDPTNHIDKESDINLIIRRRL